MLSLGIDTSTRTGVLALVRDDRLLLEETIDAKLNHSARLLPTLESALEKAGLSLAKLDCVGVGVGPGSLTGVRVAIAFGKGLVFAISKPLVAVSSLEAIAYRRRDYPGTVSVVVDARMGGYYHAAYRFRISDFGFRIGDLGPENRNGAFGGPQRSAIRNPQSAIEEVSPLCVVDREELPRKLMPASLIISPDAEAISPHLVARFPADCEMEKHPVFPSAEYIARRAIVELRSGTFDPEKMVEPVYLRPGVPRKIKLP